MSLKAYLARRLWKFWTYRWSVVVDGRRYDARLESGWTRNVFTIARDGQDLASEMLRFYEEPFRLQALEVANEGGMLRFETAPRNLYAYGLRVARGDAELFHSHPNLFAAFAGINKVANFGRTGKSKEEIARLSERTRAMWPSFWTDMAMAFLMYIVASRMSLRDAALVGAGAGMVLYGVQWILDRALSRKIDLTGGMAGFGILMLLLSAGFAWAVENELVIQLKSSVLGLICAVLFALDACFGGRYLGERMVRYITFIDIDPWRFVLASALVAAAMSLLNAGIALGMSRDAWLFYKFWGGPVLGAGLGFATLWWARSSASQPK